MITLATEPRRILIIKPSAIGDVVHTLPVLAMLRKRWPAAHIAWLVTPACSGLLEGHPLLDEVILFDRRGYAKSWRDLATAWRFFGFQRSLRQRNFDLVIDLQGLFRSGWLAWQTRAPMRVGFANAREFAPIFYTHRIDVGGPDQHAVSRYLKLAAAMGCDVSEVTFPLHVTDEDRRHVEKLIDGVGRFAVLLPGANWPTKRWPIERFAALVGPLRERFGLATVVAGGPDDVKLGDTILPSPQPSPWKGEGARGAINLAGRTSLRQLVALLERAELVIANDSGPMHIAAALGRPLIAIFGPTNPIRTGPYNRLDTVIRIEIPCSPCYSRKCSHQSCLRWLEVESVLKRIETLRH